MSFGDDDTKPAPEHAIDRLVATARGLEPDAVEVLCLVADRLAAGRRSYGALDLERDPRDWHREALKECADGLAYAAAGLIRSRRRTVRIPPGPARLLSMQDQDERPVRRVGAYRGRE